MFFEVLVMHFMCPAQGAYIRVIAAAEPFDALMDDHFVNQEIGQPVKGDAAADGDRQFAFIDHAQHDA